MIRTRREFLTGLGSLLAAPAIVHVGNLMPVKAVGDDLYKHYTSHFRWQQSLQNLDWEHSYRLLRRLFTPAT